jgi:hypothetical protein
MSTIIKAKAVPASVEKFWYALQCASFGYGYLAKALKKKVLTEAGMGKLTKIRSIWYLLQCIMFSAGYFRKVIIKRALSQV